MRLIEDVLLTFFLLVLNLHLIVFIGTLSPLRLKTVRQRKVSNKRSDGELLHLGHELDNKKLANW